MALHQTALGVEKGIETEITWYWEMTPCQTRESEDKETKKNQDNMIL